MLPGWVIWTAHERVGSDSQTGEKVIGPETAGQALSAGLMKYFGNTLHFTTALGSRNIKDSITDKQVKKSNLEYRIYTRDHFDPDGMTALVYRAVNRCKIPSKLPDYLTDPNPGQAIMQFYTIITEAAQEYMKKRLDKS
jgi:hypothetical protein